MRFLFATAINFSRSLYLQRRMASLLISNPKYSFLKELGLSEENHGVFTGEWKANGPVVDSL